MELFKRDAGLDMAHVPYKGGRRPDPAAQWTGAHKGPAFFAYSDNYLIDVKFGVSLIHPLTR